MSSDSKIKKISFNEVSHYSKWPSRLLSLEQFDILAKTPLEVTREFGLDKWGSLLNYFSDKQSFTLEEVENLEQNLDQNIPCYSDDDKFFLIKARDAQKIQLKMYESVLSKYTSSASCLVELGCGFGSKIFKLSDCKSMKSMPLYGAEYTKSGCDLTRLISKKINKKIEVGFCDFNTLEIKGIKIPKNALIFTSYSVHYVDKLNKNFIKFLADLEPSAVVHFEPCFEYFDDDNIHDLMCKRYMQMNGYTENIASNIELGASSIGATFKSKKNVFGANPFLPMSILEWNPST